MHRDTSSDEDEEWCPPTKKTKLAKAPSIPAPPAIVAATAHDNIDITYRQASECASRHTGKPLIQDIQGFVFQRSSVRFRP